jgi:hypothetical protein
MILMNGIGSTQRLVWQAACFIICLLGTALQAQRQTLYYGTSSTILASNTVQSVATDGTGNTVIFTASGGVDRCTALAVDSLNGIIFLADGRSNKVWSLSLSGGSLTSIHSVTSYVSSLALDTVNQQIYYTTSSTTPANNTVQRMDYTGLNNTLLFSFGSLGVNAVQRCTALALDTSNSLIFIADAGANAIWSTDLSGNNLTQVVGGLSGSPLDLALDPTNELVYFTTSSATQDDNTIQEVGYNGTNESVLFTATGSANDGVQRCTSLDLDLADAVVYFSDAGSNALWSLPLSGGSVTLVEGSLPAAAVKKTRLFFPSLLSTNPMVKAISLSYDLEFGTVLVNTSAHLPLTISNSGNSTLTVSGISYPPGFSGNWSGTIAAGASRQVRVKFSPVVVTGYGGTVVVHANNTRGVNTIPISGSVTNITVIVTTNGYGTVTPNLNGQNLTEGNNYTLTATANNGAVTSNIFVGWTGSINTDTSTLTFQAESNLVLQANFIPNPVLPFVGTYNGLFTNTDGIVTEQTAGMLKGLALGQNGAYSATLLINGTSHVIISNFNLTDLQVTNTWQRTTNEGGPLMVVMSLSSGPPPQVTGQVIGTNWTADLIADRATNTVPSAEYTMLIPPEVFLVVADVVSVPPLSSSPGGDGYALITNHAGTVTITGSLADGTSLGSQTVPVSEDGYVPIYDNLYSGKGLLLGWINLELTNIDDVGLTWIHPETSSGLYTNGFTNVLSAGQILLSTWTNLTTNTLLTNLTNLTLRATIGYPIILTNFIVKISNNFELGKVSGPASLSGSINPKTGFLKVTIGSGLDTTTGYGAILIDEYETNGGGYYLTKTNGQAIQLGPAQDILLQDQ